MMFKLNFLGDNGFLPGASRRYATLVGCRADVSLAVRTESRKTRNEDGPDGWKACSDGSADCLAKIIEPSR